MSRRMLVLGVAFISALAIGACDEDDDPAGNEAERFTAGPLSGANERPNPVATSATGTSSFSFQNGTLTYSLSVSGITHTAAHIHGPAHADTSAGVIVPLTVGSNQTITQSNITSATIDMDSLLVLMRTGNAYVNVHSAAFPGGEIRAQIRRQ